MIDNIDIVALTNILGGGSLLAYAFFMWAQVRGLLAPSPLTLFVVRILCAAAFVSPMAVRLYLTNQTIVFLGALLVLGGLFIKFRRMMGI